MCLSAKTETTGAEVEKVKSSANPDNFITKNILLAIHIKKMNTHTLCLCPLVRKLKAVGTMKSTEEAEDIQFHS